MIVVLAILKWIGLIIAGLLGIVLVIVALLLFVPVRYRVSAEYEDSLRYAFQFNYLYPLFSIRKKMDEPEVVLYIFGIPVKSRPGGKQGPPGENAVKKNEEPGEKNSKEKAPLKNIPEENDVERGNTASGKRREGRKNKKSRKNKKEKEKKRFSFDRISSIISFIREKETRSAIGKAKRELIALLRYLLPTKAELDFRIGTGDPATTGLIIGGISLMPFVYQKGIHIVPDFEEKVVQGNGKIKGRIRVIYFIRLLVRMYRDKELRRVWNRMNKKEAA